MSGVERGAIGCYRLARKMEPELNGTTCISDMPGDTSATIHNQQHQTGEQAAPPSHHSVPKATVGCDRLGRLAFQLAKRRIEQVGESRERAQNNCKSRRSNGDWLALFMKIRRESAQTRSETGTRRPGTGSAV